MLEACLRHDAQSRDLGLHSVYAALGSRIFRFAKFRDDSRSMATTTRYFLRALTVRWRSKAISALA